MSKPARLLVALLALLFTTFAQAGGYVASYTGGICYFDPNAPLSGGVSSAPYEPLLYDEYYAGWYGGEGWSCSGKITAVLTWVHKDPNHPELDPHPSKVVINQMCDVWTIDGGVGDNGLGESFSVPYGFSAATWNPVNGHHYDHYSVRSDDSGTITVECSPFAAKDPDSGSNVNIAYHVDAYVPGDAHIAVSFVGANGVLVPNQVAGLTYNNATGKHRQEANFAVKASVTQANGQNFPAGTQFYYQWSAAGLGGALEFSESKAQSSVASHSTTATATAPSRCLPTCDVVVVVQNGNAVSTYTSTDSRPCAAIGGEITIAIKPSGNEKGETPYPHDLNDPTKAFYMTFFNYSHDTAQHGPIPFLAQKTQGVTLKVKDQPPGTTVTWTKPSLTYTADPLIQTYTAGAPHSLLVNLDAEEAFRDGIPTARFDYVDPSVPTMTGSTSDDSASTKVPIAPGSATYVDLVYKISAHKPGMLIGSLGPPIVNDPTPVRTYSAPDQGAVAWTEVSDYTYLLVDTFNEPMPGVRVQERFTTAIPNGFRVNTTQKFWNTVRKSKDDAGVFLMKDGYFNASDRLSFEWFGTPVDFTPTHVFYAGTEDVNPGVTTGVRLGTYQIVFKPGTPQSQQNVNAIPPGGAGSARQSKTQP